MLKASKPQLSGSPEEPLRRWVGECLTGASTQDFPPANPATVTTFLDAHGIGPCLNEMCRENPALRPLFQNTSSMNHRIAEEMLRQQAFISVINSLRSESPKVELLVIKGQALAHQIYPHPWLRPRGDIDALVSAKDVESVIRVLRELGYQQATAIDGELVLRQTSLSRSKHGIGHVWDLHWSISNRPALAEVLPYQELLTRAVEVPLNGTSFLAPDNVDALLVACAHLVGHHLGEPRMIWLYDIHLLAQSLSAADERRFLERATRQSSLQSACHAALSLTGKYLPADRTTTLARALDPGPGGRWKTQEHYFRRLLDDAHAVGRGRRLQLLGQHLFPSRAYMMRRFGIRRRWQLPFWYAIRIGRAIPKLFRRR